MWTDLVLEAQVRKLSEKNDKLNININNFLKFQQNVDTFFLLYQSPDRSQDQFNLTQGNSFWTPYWIFSIKIKIKIHKTNTHCTNTQQKTSHQKLLLHKMQKLSGCLTYSRRWQITGVQTWWSWRLQPSRRLTDTLVSFCRTYTEYNHRK